MVTHSHYVILSQTPKATKNDPANNKPERKGKRKECQDLKSLSFHDFFKPVQLCSPLELSFLLRVSLEHQV